MGVAKEEMPGHCPQAKVVRLNYEYLLKLYLLWDIP